ncbi:hypothetical protein N9N28_12515 [Rubripirellula amarantea]|nr:hypothetical protein [Rubripirellula amarantea]
MPKPAPRVYHDPTTSTKLDRKRWTFVAAVASLIVLVVFAAWWLIPQRSIRAAETAIKSRRFEEATVHVESYPWWGPQIKHAFFMRGRIARMSGDWVEANRLLGQALGMGCDPALIDRERKLVQVQGGAAPQIADLLDQYVNDAPDDAAASFDAFVIGYLAAGMPEKADQIAARWQAFDPSDPRSSFYRGVAAQQTEKREVALDHFAQATALEPRFIESHFASASLLKELGRNQEAYETYRTIHLQLPERVDVRLALGETLWALNRRDDAVEALKPIAKADPSIYRAGYLIGEQGVRTGDAEGIIEFVEPMMKHFPENGPLNYQLAVAYARQGDDKRHANAMAAFMEANGMLDLLRFQSFAAESRMDFAQLMDIAEKYYRYQWQGGPEWYAKAMAVNPGHLAPRQALLRYMLQSGAFEQAKVEQRIIESVLQDQPLGG